MPIRELRDSLHGLSRAWAEVDQQPRSWRPSFPWKEWTYLSEVLWSPSPCILGISLESRTRTAVVSHLEKVPRHAVSWELAKPTLSKLSNLFLKCSFSLMSYTVNLKLEKVTENKYHYGKNTMLFKTLQAVWHVVLHLKMLHLIKKN